MLRTRSHSYSHTTGLYWPSWIPDVFGVQQGINDAAQTAAQQEKIRQEAATASVQSTIAEQAGQQEQALQQSTMPTQTAVTSAANTVQTVAWVVGGAAVIALGWYVLKGKK